MSLTELIQKLEAAKEGSRELDELIHEAAGSPGADDPQYAAFESGDDFPRNYTTSLDAALTLVPDGWNYQLLKTGGVLLSSGLPYSASIKASSQYGWVDPPYPFDGYSETQALALCIAALKAREAAR